MKGPVALVRPGLCRSVTWPSRVGAEPDGLLARPTSMRPPGLRIELVLFILTVLAVVAWFVWHETRPPAPIDY
ncbi:hypothetical protein GCM10020369_47060 [Cryptosporangium minutisporangium]|uniref:Uncharacterized protein n=1 Tax=Cryptosporangium minutisporangium TaxID=113569 RepID=A0ABP6T3F3_9ACTN